MSEGMLFRLNKYMQRKGFEVILLSLSYTNRVDAEYNNALLHMHQTEEAFSKSLRWRRKVKSDHDLFYCIYSFLRGEEFFCTYQTTVTNYVIFSINSQ